MEADYSPPRFESFYNFRFQFIGERDPRACRQGSARSRESFPEERLYLTNEKNLDLRSFDLFALPGRSHSPACESGGKNSRVIDHERVSGAEEIRQVIESRILKMAACAIEYEEARAVSLSRGLLRDQVFGQMIVEI